MADLPSLFRDVQGKLSDLALLFASIAAHPDFNSGAAGATAETTGRRGRPPGSKNKDAAPADAPPVENDKECTADHPKRVELKKLGKQYSELTDVASAQKAMKLFGENSNMVPDAELAGACGHFAGLIKKIQTPVNRYGGQTGWAEIYNCLRRNGFRPVVKNETSSVPDCFYVR